MEAVDVLRKEIARIEGENDALRTRIERNLVSHHTLVEMVRVLSGDSDNKVGPTKAVLSTLQLNPGLSRRELTGAALKIVNTDAEKADKTIRQTILNHINNGRIKDVDGRLYLQGFVSGSDNGHSEQSP